MKQRNLTFVCFMHIFMLILLSVYADPGYDHLNRNSDDGFIDVESDTEPLESSLTNKQLRLGKPSAEYADYSYDYYMNGKRSNLNNAGDNGLSASSSAIRVPGGDRDPGRSRIDEMPLKPLPWYNQYPGKSVAMYPSRSYDPYIRRYDRFDEQYHRAYPQYYEDMYVHRQRFDPYDSYSPRVPQYPEPYLMYPDRHLDTPQARDYIKSRRGYMDDTIPMPIVDSYSHKYPTSKLPHQMAIPRNERVVYYAHLPEIVRTPYDLSMTRTDRNAATAALTEPVPYKLNKKKLKNLPRGGGGGTGGPTTSDNSTNYKQMF